MQTARALLGGVLAAAALLVGARASTATHSSPGAPGGVSAAPLDSATFAGGCFWCMEPPFDALDGVVSTTSGYTGGTLERPTYEQVSAGGTGHAEAVRVVYDPAKVSYARLLDVFWHNVDPLTADAQFCDEGSQYRSAIFYHGDEQRRLAEASRQRLVESHRFDRPIVTQIVAAGAFYPAEGYHQDYYKKNPTRYKFYKWNCGRDRRLQALWGKDAPHADDRP
jgi:peptide-methionine (S)-S-oxide reductase